MAKAGAHYPRVGVRSRAEWRAWLERNHASSTSVWCVTFKRGHPDYVPYEETVREALCFGWIDSVPRKVDSERTSHLMSPRSPKSAWSGLNKRFVAEAEEAGLLHPAGKAAIERAKANGMWTFLDDVERLEVPEDLAAAFAAVPGSRDAWNAFPSSARRGNLEWIKQAKRPQTRVARIERTASAALLGKRVP